MPLLLCLLALPALAATNDLTSLLQRGLFEEEANRNLDAAITSYESLAKQFDKDRQIAATAVFRLGECYRKLGKTNEAVVQYERILRDFSDQQTLATLSRQNLTGLGSTTQSSVPASIVGGATLDNLQSQYALLKAQLEQARKETNFNVVARLFDDEGLKKALVMRRMAEIRLMNSEPNKQSAEESLRGNDKLVEEARQQLFDYQERRLAILQSAIRQTRPEPLQPLSSADNESSANDGEEKEIRRIQAMIQNSPDLINARGGEDATTPLIRAAFKDQLRVARFLLDHGADVNARGASGETALFAAAKTGHKSMVELLLDSGADINAQRDRYGPNVLAKPLTALDCAVSEGYPSVVSVLLAHKADPNIRGGDDLMPLHRVAKKFNRTIAELLLKNGADVNAKGGQNGTPLHYAAEGESADMVALLLANKAEVNAHNSYSSDWTPLHYAASANRAENIKLLVAKGAEVNARDKADRTPLLVAARENATEAAGVLLDAKADPNLVTTDNQRQGWGPLHFAADSGYAEIAGALLQHGANPDALTQKYRDRNGNSQSGDTPLGLAVFWNRAEAVKALLQYKANPNLPNAEGVRPLTMAVQSSNPQRVAIARALLEAGADVNVPGKDGMTPLQLATASGDKSLVETVLAFHPDVNAQNNYGRTALDFVRNNSQFADIAALLRANGALDSVPDFKSIRVDRQGLEQPIIVHRADTNGRNRFTLFETILSVYSMNNTFVPYHGMSQAPAAVLTFPALDRVIMHRPAGKSGGKERQIVVNLLNATNGVDCAKDMMLEFGDVVEIPMREHALNAASVGLSSEEVSGLERCLKRSVQLKVRGQSKTIEFYPTGSYLKTLLGGAEAQSMLLSSSDLSRVKVTRRDSTNGKQRWWLLDCTDNNGRFVPASPGIGGIGIPRPRTSVSNNQNNADDNDLWLRDGDVIEVPEK